MNSEWPVRQRQVERPVGWLVLRICFAPLQFIGYIRSARAQCPLTTLNIGRRYHNLSLLPSFPFSDRDH